MGSSLPHSTLPSYHLSQTNDSKFNKYNFYSNNLQFYLDSTIHVCCSRFNEIVYYNFCRNISLNAVLYLNFNFNRI